MIWGRRGCPKPGFPDKLKVECRGREEGGKVQRGAEGGWSSLLGPCLHVPEESMISDFCIQDIPLFLTPCN